jgi:prepilin-type N-terminal cleavage/methylation domain-containing protein
MDVLMKPIMLNKRGFTLIEVIISIVVLTIISVIAGMGLVSIAKGYALTKENTANAQKVQIAMARIVKELAATESISSGNANSITFNSKSLPLKTDRVISWAANTLSIDGHVLLDHVNSFDLAYYKFYNDTTPTSYSSTSTAIIQVTIGLKGENNDIIVKFVDRVYLLNMMAGIGT